MYIFTGDCVCLNNLSNASFQYNLKQNETHCADGESTKRVRSWSSCSLLQGWLMYFKCFSPPLSGKSLLEKSTHCDRMLMTHHVSPGTVALCRCKGLFSWKSWGSVHTYSVDMPEFCLYGNIKHAHTHTHTHTQPLKKITFIHNLRPKKKQNKTEATLFSNTFLHVIQIAW